MAQNIGKITQIIGPVIDISFDMEGSELPHIYDALEIEREGMEIGRASCRERV